MSFYVLHPKELEITQKRTNAIIVDVRTYKSYQEYHYKGAVNMPYCDSEQWLNRFCIGKIYILYCDYGNISLLVARKLAKRGIVSYTVVGGAKEIRNFW